MTNYERTLVSKLCKDLEKLDLNVVNFIGETALRDHEDVVTLANIHIKECSEIISELLNRDLEKCDPDYDSAITFPFILKFAQYLRRMFYKYSGIEEMEIEEMQKEIQAMPYYKIYVLLHTHYNI